MVICMNKMVVEKKIFPLIWSRLLTRLSHLLRTWYLGSIPRHRDNCIGGGGGHSVSFLVHGWRSRLFETLGIGIAMPPFFVLVVITHFETLGIGTLVVITPH